MTTTKKFKFYLHQNNSFIQIKMIGTIIYVGDEFITNEGYKITVKTYIDASNIYVSFEDGNIVKVQASQIRNKNIKNKNHKSVFGVGYFGYGKFSKLTNKKAYNVWQSMLCRCYSEKYQEKQPTYIGCLVDESWHNFQVFAEWFESNYIFGFQLDKDLLFKGNKTYSEENCSFLPAELNNALITNQSKNSTLPVGIYKIKNRFVCKCRNENYVVITKYFEDLNDAVSWYKTTKEKYVKRLSEIFKDKLTVKSYNALQKWEV